jgi:hypothetical protein
MKKIIVAAAIILTSGVTAWSVTKSNKPAAESTTPVAKQSDFAVKTFAGNKDDLAKFE